MFRGTEATGHQVPAVLEVSTEEYACSNCHTNEKVDKILDDYRARAAKGAN